MNIPLKRICLFVSVILLLTALPGCEHQEPEIETVAFSVDVSIAGSNEDPITYSLEVIAKDGPLGNVQWSTSYTLSGSATIHLPGYLYYIFKATKSGHVPHIQYFPVSELPASRSLNFEFLPNSLEDFIVYKESDAFTLYIAKDRCKLHARIDLEEGAALYYVYVDKTAMIPAEGVKTVKFKDCTQDAPLSSPCGNAVNFFNNKPHDLADSFCDEIDQSVHPLEDFDIDTFIQIYYHKPGQTVLIESYFNHSWPGK